MQTKQNLSLKRYFMWIPLVPRVPWQVRTLPRLIFRYLTNLNLFPTVPPPTNQDRVRTQRVSTRVFILSLTLSLTILLLYTCTVTFIKTVTVKQPTLNQFTDLYQQYPQTLTCPCTEISTNYETFIQINQTMHQVCTSAFLQDDWLTNLARSSGRAYWTDDFRFSGPFIFLALGTLCQSAETSISSSRLQFYSANYISAFAVPPDQLRSQSEAYIQQFISSTTNNYLSSLRLIRDTTQANALLSAKLSNYGLYVPSGSEFVYEYPFAYDENCTCASSSSCVLPSKIFKNNDRSLAWFVPGFYRGCFILEALRRSHLECLYNQTCLSQLLLYLNFTTPVNTTALDSSASDYFHPSMIIEEILGQLMVDHWNWTITHDHYYASCQPTECTYRITARNDAIYIVTTLIGLIGGLVTALKLLVPRLVWFIRRCWHRRTLSSGNSQGL